MLTAISLIAFTAMASQTLAKATTPAYGTLRTRWFSQVSQTLPHPEYPRPSMVRKNWVNLNGKWDLSVQLGGATTSLGKILVPFPVESQLSGVQKMISPEATLIYKRSFVRPKGARVLLHFGAVDWHAVVYVNGEEVGEHKGGYTPFSFDVTYYLRSSGAQTLTVQVQDPTDTGDQARGKQVSKPEGIFYTPTTGIWQTVWLESVPKVFLSDVQVRTWNTGSVRVEAHVDGAYRLASATVEVLDGERVVAKTTTFKVEAGPEWGPTFSAGLRVNSPVLWSPDRPHRYTARLCIGGKGGDEVRVPFGFREIRVGKAPDGKTRVLLNGKPIFMTGPLDQGFWPDGLYAAPTYEAMLYDLKVTQRLGFNMIRKHVKVEPDTWYDACDRMGLLVMQDMPSRWFAGDKPTDAGQDQYLHEQARMVNTLRNHPSVVCWVPYNEGWGQFNTPYVVNWLRNFDPTRLIDNASGWTDTGVGDLSDVHVYPGPGAPKAESKRALVLGEFGGLGLAVPGHTWKPSGWGYQSFKSADEMMTRLEGIFASMHVLVGDPGLSAAVYTQTTDVETEINGLMSYDREVLKVDAKRMRAANLALHRPAPVVRTIVPTAREGHQVWWYTFEQPKGDWFKPGFDASVWSLGEGGFGTSGTPGSIVRTEWRTPDIWIRRQFMLPKIAIGSKVALSIHHDEDAEVYLDGVRIAILNGYVSDYSDVPLPSSVRKLLVPGPHILSIHCRQTSGGQYIDAGLVSIQER